jgi:hypothetical protein
VRRRIIPRECAGAIGKWTETFHSGTLQSPPELKAYLMEGLTMQMQIDTHKGDPAEDRGAFIGGVLGCLVVLGALLVAYMLV